MHAEIAVGPSRDLHHQRVGRSDPDHPPARSLELRALERETSFRRNDIRDRSAQAVAR